MKQSRFIDFDAISGKYKPDCQTYVSGADIRHNEMITRATHGLPVGNGIMGSLIWNQDDHTLHAQINRVDVFGYNSAGTGVHAHEDYGYGCGQIHIDFGGNPFAGAVSHHLSLYEGRLEITGHDLMIELVCDMSRDLFAVNIQDNRSQSTPISIDLTMLQKPDTLTGTHEAKCRVGHEHELIWLTQTFSQPAATGFSSFDHYCKSALGIRVIGPISRVTCPDHQTIRLALPSGPAEYTLYIGSHASMDQHEDVLSKMAETIDAGQAAGFEGIRAGSQAWWRHFWSRSFIRLSDEPEMVAYQNRWLYYLYLSAISMRGRYPAKFSGLIWNTQGLHRPWGAMFWGYNQECLHYSWAAANHLELQQPYFSMHMRNYERYATAARQQWGSDGLFICETEAHNGPELLPDQIAADLQAFMLRGTEPSPELADFASRRHDHLSRWQIYPTYWTTFTTINASEKAEHFWKHYLYTGDRQFLAEQAYPMLKGAALFYCRFPNLRMEADGYYHIWRTNHHEHILGGRDVIDDLSFIRGVMQAAMKAAEILDTDDDLRKEWQDVLDHVTPYHLSSQPDAIGAITHPQGKETWCQGLQPATATRGLFGAESPRLRMLENYDLLTLETKDQHLDTHGEWELANQTFEAHPGYRSNMEMGNYQYAGGRYLLDAARLGRCEYMTILYEQNQRINQRTKGSVNQLGFTTSDLEELQGYGIFSAGLQEGLMQSIAPLPGLDPVIRVFPAWDKARFAAFTLLAQGGFLVSSAVEHGEVVFVSVESQLGGPCRIRNPWPEHDCHVYRNGSLETSIRQSLISFPTRTGDQIILMNH